MTFAYGGPGNLDFSAGENEQLKNVVEGSFKPFEQQTQATLKRRGFGGDFMAPGIEAQAFSPLLAQKSQSLTDLFFKREADNRGWEEQRRVGRATDEQLKGAKQARRQGDTQFRQQQAQMKYLCTELHRQGRIPTRFMRADKIFLSTRVTPQEHARYRAWGMPLAERMKANKWLSNIVYFFVYPWNVFMYRTVKGEKLWLLGGIGSIINTLGNLYGMYYEAKQRRMTNELI